MKICLNNFSLPSMNLKKFIIVFTLFMFHSIYSQINKNEVPYKEKPEYSSKKVSFGLIMAKKVDELGYKYYWATDSLLNDELRKSFHSSNLPRLLLDGLSLMSEYMIKSVSHEKMDSILKPEGMSFDDLKKNTLFNLAKVSNLLINNQNVLGSINFNLFTNSIAIANSYCDQIILFRENIGKPFKLKNNLLAKPISNSEMFEKKMGADGILNEQWMKIMKGGGGRHGSDKIRSQSRINSKVLAELRKEKYINIETGKLEKAELYSNIVEGLTYTYFNEPPKQLSFLYSNDDELVEGIIEWIIYVNSGNPIKLSEMFRLGLDIVSTLDDYESQLIKNNKNYRDIIDREGNKIRLEFPKEIFNTYKFIDMTINEIHINGNNRFEFIGRVIKKDYIDENFQLSTVILKNIEGSLLNRIKGIINLMREGVEYDKNTILNLRKY